MVTANMLFPLYGLYQNIQLTESLSNETRLVEGRPHPRAAHPVRSHCDRDVPAFHSVSVMLSIDSLPFLSSAAAPGVT